MNNSYLYNSLRNLKKEIIIICTNICEDCEKKSYGKSSQLINTLIWKSNMEPHLTTRCCLNSNNYTVMGLKLFTYYLLKFKYERNKKMIKK